jgi:hypothetical protein
MRLELACPPKSPTPDIDNDAQEAEPVDRVVPSPQASADARPWQLLGDTETA